MSDIISDKVFLTQSQPAQPCTMIIFGAAGDLSKRLLYPAICNLGSKNLLNEKFYIINISLEEYNTESFREYVSHAAEEFIKDNTAKEFALNLLSRIYYIAGGFDDEKMYNNLKNLLKKLEIQENISQNYLFYFATPPVWVAEIAQRLSQAGLLLETQNNFRRIIVEKPFGHDLISSKLLNQQLLQLLNESQIFRMDHFLGKETVQNLLAFRFSNSIFEPLWNRQYIDHIQITATETLGVEQRASYYEQTGALRDMVPNHLLQVLSLIAMEPPIRFLAECIRDEKSKVLAALEKFKPEDVLARAVRGQYGRGQIKNIIVPGYREEENISPTSITETYAALKLFLNNWRWLDVPFYLRTGKRLAARASEIIIQFKPGPAVLFASGKQSIMPNILRIKIQPDEGISLRFNAKIPGPSMILSPMEMSFKYSDYFGVAPQTGYETVLYDCMKGDQTLFKRAEMVEAGWALVQPILDVWGALKPQDFPNYAAGSWGPPEADRLLELDGRAWI